MIEDLSAGPVVELDPDACPEGHSWGPPVRGVVRVIRSRPACGCRHAYRGHHRAWHCERPGCPRPWVRAGPCDEDPEDEDMTTWRPAGPGDDEQAPGRPTRG